MSPEQPSEAEPKTFKRITTDEGRILECRATSWERQLGADTAPASMGICTTLDLNGRIPMTDGIWQVPIVDGKPVHKLSGLEVFHDELGPEGRWVKYRGVCFIFGADLFCYWMQGEQSPGQRPAYRAD